MKLIVLVSLLTLSQASPTRVKRTDDDATHNKLSGIVDELRKVAHDIEVRNQEERGLEGQEEVMNNEDLGDVFEDDPFVEEARGFDEMSYDEFAPDSQEYDPYQQAEALFNAMNGGDQGDFEREGRMIPAPGRGHPDSPWFDPEENEEIPGAQDPSSQESFEYERRNHVRIPAPGRGGPDYPREGRMIPAPGRGHPGSPWFNEDESDEFDADDDDDMVDEDSLYELDREFDSSEFEALENDYLGMDGRSLESDEDADSVASVEKKRKSKCAGCSVSCGQGEEKEDSTCNCESCCFCRCGLQRNGRWWRRESWSTRAVCR